VVEDRLSSVQLHSDGRPARFASFVARVHTQWPKELGRELLQSAKRANRHSASVQLHSDGRPAGFASFVARVHTQWPKELGRELLQSAKRANRHSAGMPYL
jgi:hypothetical protein